MVIAPLKNMVQERFYQRELLWAISLCLVSSEQILAFTLFLFYQTLPLNPRVAPVDSFCGSRVICFLTSILLHLRFAILSKTKSFKQEFKVKSFFWYVKSSIVVSKFQLGVETSFNSILTNINQIILLVARKKLY